MDKLFRDILGFSSALISASRPKKVTINPHTSGYLGENVVFVKLEKQPDKHSKDYGKLFRCEIVDSTDGSQKLVIKDQLSSGIFRIGGICSGFRDGYCNLIYYPEFGAWGNHCIIDKNGKIIMESDDTLDHISHLKGVIATCKNKYYSLLTGQLIAEGYHSIKSNDYLFVESTSKDYTEHDVIKITFRTGAIEIFK